MKRKFWQLVHDWLERAWHWVWRTKISNPPAGEYKCREYTFPCGSGEMGTVYWSKGGDLNKFPQMNEATPEQMDWFSKKPDGSLTNIRPVAIFDPKYPYRCDVCETEWTGDKPFCAPSCPNCGSCRTVAL